MNRSSRCPLRSPWILVLLILGGASAALSDEQTLEGSRQFATVLTNGGLRGTGGRLVGTTALGEGLLTAEMRGGNFVMHPGFLAMHKFSQQPTSVQEETGAPTAKSRLIGSRPNPFNPSTTVQFDLARTGATSLKIYDVRGRLVRTLVDGAMDSGRHQMAWDGRNNSGRPVASGVYLLEMVAGEYRGRHKMILAR